MNREAFSVPILLLVFNRPDLTSQVFDAIRRIRPQRLYISADAPRINSQSDKSLCDQVRHIVTNVDWPCELNTQFFSVNQGCRDGEALGMQWFFSHEHEGIVLEDDTLPTHSFFPYAQTLLERYRDNSRIFTISGNCYLPPSHSGDSSYFFSRYADFWGWAGWRRSWETYDRFITDFPSWRLRDGLLDIFPSHQDVRTFWYDIFDRVHREKVDTWDYQMLFNIWSNSGFSIMPSVNLVRNLGFRSDGTHTTSSSLPSWLNNARFGDLSWPLLHPADICVNSQYDYSFFRSIFLKSRRHSLADLLRMSGLRSRLGI